MSPHALHRTTSHPLERGVARTRTTSRSFAGVGIAAQCRAMSVRAFINSPTGPRTTHFWGPVANWGFVLAVRPSPRDRRRRDARRTTDDARRTTTGTTTTTWTTTTTTTTTTTRSDGREATDAATDDGGATPRDGRRAWRTRRSRSR
jgi:hypothetical protein